MILWCLLVGHVPIAFDEAPLMLITRHDGTQYKVELCDRCGTVYGWSQ